MDVVGKAVRWSRERERERERDLTGWVAATWCTDCPLTTVVADSVCLRPSVRQVRISEHQDVQVQT